MDYISGKGLQSMAEGQGHALVRNWMRLSTAFDLGWLAVE